MKRIFTILILIVASLGLFACSDENNVSIVPTTPEIEAPTNGGTNPDIGIPGTPDLSEEPKEDFDAYEMLLNETKKNKEIIDLEVLVLRATIDRLEAEKISLVAKNEDYESSRYHYEQLSGLIKTNNRLIAEEEEKLIELNGKLETASPTDKPQLIEEINIAESSIRFLRDLNVQMGERINNSPDYKALIIEIEAKITTINAQLTILNTTLEDNLVEQGILEQLYITLLEMHDQVN